jgi:NADH-quinone oxidoreductase subunit J
MLAALAFYFFAAILIASAIMVIAAKNPVHSVLFLILAFFNAAGLFVLMGAEFLAMILVVVYVGAVAVLFLFVVMMLDIDFAELKRGALQYLPFGVLIGLILVAELVMAGSAWVLKPVSKTAFASATPAGVSNTAALGHILYTDYVYYFQIAGLVLLVAMIGAIVLTLRARPGVRRQVIAVQNARTAAMAVDMVDIQPGQGAQQEGA